MVKRMKHKKDDTVFCILHRDLLKSKKGDLYGSIIAWHNEYEPINEYLEINNTNECLILATVALKKFRKKFPDYEEYELVFIKDNWMQRKFASQYWDVIQEEQAVFNSAIGLCDMIMSNDECEKEEKRILRRAMEIFADYRDLYQEVNIDSLKEQQELTDEWKRHVEDEKA